MLDNLQQMVVLATVAHEQHFTRAAEYLGISKSQVSKQIRFLEARLGVQLVQRNTRSVALTEAGKQYAAFGHQIVETMQNAEAVVAGFRNEVSGRLRVGIAQSFGNAQITQLLSSFQAQFPELELEVHLFDHCPNLVENGFDCWLVIHEVPSEGMVTRKLGDCQFKLVASPSYIEKNGTPKHPSDLREHNCITYQNVQHIYDQWSFQRDGSEQSVTVRGSYRINNAPAVLEAAKSGVGIAYIATYLLNDEIKNGELNVLMKDWKPTMKLPVYAVYPRREYLAPKVRHFVSFLSENIRVV
ncbi:LysR family transcriptional regulator [Grimontia hollisae]|uniref:Transcriptional regulator LysR family n=1 Tax=Grimontia hollisae CIP 101886 TaxID=675812 RepID=D0I5G7_GRIHO|nr:LysR family transcriptional regulator [Grimontia hollisae]AMG29251.1 LysR family transcriptional regulator [Grimontia hollisae]EEY73131.1 transcriptional regulator LysR family [Grimontia hollisae CIP 101886]STO76581.1 D-malate degradation protein R [Grimontia hollisae]STQ76165.1 D-malate degradation protein R [Grimontia hollisae]